MKSKMKTSNKWKQRFWKLAEHVSQWSKDKAKVGAIVVTKRGGAIALGYNGFPIGVEDSAERLKNKKVKLDMVVHAEQNALLIAGKSANGAEIYVWGKPICSRCAGIIIQSGITKIIAVDPEIDKGSSWYETGRLSIKMFEEAGLEIEYIK